ncbi:MAG: DUF2007 domain-containing protein, partial [Thermoguttaceae bacterium]
MTPDIVEEAVAFFNETAEDEQFDLSLPAVCGYVLAPLEFDQIEPLTTLLLEQGFADVEAVPREEDRDLFELQFSEERVHTVDSYADRVEGLADFARQHGLEIIDWSVEALPEDDVQEDERPAEPPATFLPAFFTFPYQADIVRFRLELEGIPTRLADEMLVGWFWKYSNAVGGVKIIVKDEDLPRALEILRDEQAASAARAAEPPSRGPQRWACPHCGARVPNDFCVCWACGTAADGQTDPAFEVADAPAADSDPDRPVPIRLPLFTLIWPVLPLVLMVVLACPAILLLSLPLFAYQILLY